jgi:hypothetical protein
LIIEPWGGGCRQLDAYNDALNKYYKKVRYIAFFDADEFLYDNGGNPKKTIAEIFAQHPEAGGIGVNWQLFGSSGHVKKPQGGVLENYLHRAETQWKINLHIKSIVNPRKTLVFVRNPHAADYFKNFCAVTCSGIPVEDAITKTVDVTKMHLNHYWSKSREDFEIKRSRGRATCNLKRSDEEFKFNDRNEIYDDSMLKYAELLKNCR